jgi:hypothetical protein
MLAPARGAGIPIRGAIVLRAGVALLFRFPFLLVPLASRQRVSGEARQPNSEEGAE